MKAFFFSHDANARHDPKIVALRSIYGYEGYGWWWAILEILREDKELKFPITKFQMMALSEELKTNIDMLQKFLQSCFDIGLLQAEENGDGEKCIICVGLENRIGYYKERAKKAALTRWHGADYANSMLAHDSSNAKRCHQTKPNQTKPNQKKKQVASKRKLTEEEFLKKIRSNYSWIDIDKEMKKIDGWLLAHPGRQKTRRFVINWLNKIDKPMEVKKEQKFTHASHQEWVEPDYAKGR